MTTSLILPSGVAPATPAMAVAPVPRGTVPGSPYWWVHQLETELEGRRKLVELYEDYVDGRHRLTFASQDYREAFAQMLAGVCDNWMPLILQAKTERQHVQGFNVGDSKGDKAALEIWRENHLDVDSDLVHWEASKAGEAYELTWPEETPGVFGRFFRRKSGLRPRITVEHPSQVVVRREAGDRRRRAAAFKKWQEDDETVMGTLWLPDRVYRFQRRPGADSTWEPRQHVAPESRHDFGVVPVVPVVNLPQMLASRSATPAMLQGADSWIGLGRSDLADFLGTQDELNKLVADMLLASEVGAFRQRYAIGITVEKDPKTGKPVKPFEPGADQLWITGGKRGDVEFGEFSATELKNFAAGYDNRVQSLSARSRTPPHYLTGKLVNVNAGALKASETGLTRKSRHSNRCFGESHGETVGLGLQVLGDDRGRRATPVTIWENPETVSEGELIDSLVKKLSIGVPPEQLWADAGYDPEKIAWFKTVLADEGQRQIAAAAAGAVARERGARVPDEPAPPPADD